MSCLVIYLEGFSQVRLLEKLGDGWVVVGLGVGGGGGGGWVCGRFLLILRIGKANQ